MATVNGAIINQQFEYATNDTGAPEGNRLALSIDNVSGVQFSPEYSVGGMPLSTETFSNTYDAERRLITVSRDDTLIARYTYNAFGERIKKEVFNDSGASKSTYFLYEGSAVSAQASDDGTIDTQYLYLERTRAIAKIQGEDLYAIHTDHLGTPRRMSDSNGAVVWDVYIEPFGKAHVLLDTVSLDLRLPGQVFDAETGTHYNYFRDYDPDQGRYLTSDPIGLSGGVNTFLYAYADPVSLADPWGLRVILMDRDLRFPVGIGRHQFLVIIPDKPQDFQGSYDLGYGAPIQLMDVGNGEMGFIIGAQNIEAGGIAEGFNVADTTATIEIYTGDTGFLGIDSFNADQAQCALPIDANGATEDDSVVITRLLANITNFNANEGLQNIPYPGVGGLLDDDDGYVNSNSWTLSVLEFSGITPATTNFSGMDFLNVNRLDPDYFTAFPNLADLTLENTDTDGDGYLDAKDNDDDNDGVLDANDSWPIDSSRS